MMRRRGRPMRAGSNGFILIAVLWILGALAALAAVSATYVASTAISVAVDNDAIRAEALASAAVELAAERLLAAPEEQRPTGGTFAFRVGRANISVAFRTEGARIDLNMAPKELLAGLFAALGAQPVEADQYAERIVGWRSSPGSESQDKESTLYRAAGLAYGPRGAPFAHVGELSLVLGIPPGLAERALPDVTVFSGRAEVNVREAAPEVIAALPGMTPERLNGVLAQRAALQPGDSVAALLGPGQNAATTSAGKATRVAVSVALENGRRISSEAVILVDGRDEPFRVLSWQVDIDAGADIRMGAAR
jgi:general secretion pathway protein K